MDSLQTFEKPDQDFLKDKECLICLETMMDLEMNHIVKLPCGCANSAYHMKCILQLLESGKKKNFCPHCKTKYTILVKKIVPLRKVVPLVPFVPFVPLRNTYFESLDRYNQMEIFTRIMIFHVVNNSIMNLICVCVSINHPSYNTLNELPLLLIFSICKLFINYGNLVYSKNNIEKIESVLLFNYLYQMALFGLTISVFTKVNPNNCSMALLLNHLIFAGIDVGFRLITEYKFQNRVTAVIP
jgi:hypothetical protein